MVTRRCVFPQAPGFADVVLPTEMTSRVNQLVVSTRNTKNNSAPFRHILFYGPPGLLTGIARTAPVSCASSALLLGLLPTTCVRTVSHGRAGLVCLGLTGSGTGKTMVAKRLARSAGLDYAVRRPR